MGIVAQFKAEIVTLYTMASPDTGENELVLHVKTSDAAGLMEALRKHGFEVEERVRQQSES